MSGYRQTNKRIQGKSIKIIDKITPETQMTTFQSFNFSNSLPRKENSPYFLFGNICETKFCSHESQEG